MLKIFGFSIPVLITLACTTPKVAPSPDPVTADTIKSTPTNYDTTSASLLYTIPQSSKYFTIDKLNQVYLVSETNEIIKYNSKGFTMFRYNNNFLEDLGHVDAADPFNVLLYYPDYLNVITLDRTMNQTGLFDLSALNLLQVNAVGSSNDNNVWIYDEIAFKLKKIDRKNEVLRESINLNLQLNYTPRPTFLIEQENTVFVSDPEYGILVFNNFGQYDAVIELKGINRFQIQGQQLIFQRDKKLYSYHLQTLDTKEIKIPIQVEDGMQLLLQQNRLFVQGKDRIEVFQLKK